VCWFWLLVLPGIRTIFNRALRVILLVVAFVVLWWNNWCLCSSSISVSAVLYKASFILSVSNGTKFSGRFQSRFHPKLDHGNRCYHTKNPEHWKWAGFTTKSWHFKFTLLAPIKYLSSNHIRTWSRRSMCSFSSCFTSRCQICDRTIIGWIGIENTQISPTIWCYFTAIQRILVRSQIRKREVTGRLTLHNVCIDCVMIPSELRYSIGAKVAGTFRWNCGPSSTRPHYRGFMSGLGNNPAKRTPIGYLDGSGTQPDCSSSPILDCLWVTWNCSWYWAFCSILFHSYLAEVSMAPWFGGVEVRRTMITKGSRKSIGRLLRKEVGSPEEYIVSLNSKWIALQ